MNTEKPIFPRKLHNAIGNETIIFKVDAQRKHPISTSVGYIIFHSLLMMVPLCPLLFFLVPLFRDGKVLYYAGKGNNRILVETTWYNFMDNLFIVIFLFGLFFIIALGMLVGAVSSLRKKGGCFIGTERKLIHYNEGEIISYQWNLFRDEMKIDTKRNDLTLHLWKALPDASTKDFNSEKVFLSGIENVVEVADFCKKQIQESRKSSKK